MAARPQADRRTNRASLSPWHYLPRTSGDLALAREWQERGRGKSLITRRRRPRSASDRRAPPARSGAAQRRREGGKSIRQRFHVVAFLFRQAGGGGEGDITVFAFAAVCVVVMRERRGDEKASWLIGLGGMSSLSALVVGVFGKRGSQVLSRMHAVTLKKTLSEGGQDTNGQNGCWGQRKENIQRLVYTSE